MPASTVEILSKKWEQKDLIFSEIAYSSNESGLYFSYYNHDLMVKIEPLGDSYLSFEIRTSQDLIWYLEKYPQAKNEPEYRIPYLFFSDNEKYYSVAIANNYLDDLLIWKFSREYLKRNPTHSILVNKEQLFDVNNIPEEYFKNWCFAESVN